MKNDNWYEGGSKNGYGGMKRFEGRDRRIERRTIEHPDGRRETIETITEEDVRSIWFSAKNFFEYKVAAGAFERLTENMAKGDTPLHQLHAMKSDIMRELRQEQIATAIPHQKKWS